MRGLWRLINCVLWTLFVQELNLETYRYALRPTPMHGCVLWRIKTRLNSVFTPKSKSTTPVAPKAHINNIDLNIDIYNVVSFGVNRHHKDKMTSKLLAFRHLYCRFWYKMASILLTFTDVVWHGVRSTFNFEKELEGNISFY